MIKPLFSQQTAKVVRAEVLWQHHSLDVSLTTSWESGVYAELNVSLKSPVVSTTLSYTLQANLGKSAIPAAAAVASTALVGYVHQVVGAAAFPDSTMVVYLHITADEIMVYVFGPSIPQIKQRCAWVLKQLERFPALSLGEASARILVPINGTDEALFTGKRVSWLKVFWDAIKEKSLTKIVPSAVGVALVIYNFVPSSAPVLSAIIGLVAAAIGAVAEALWSAWITESWKWKESK